MRTLTGRVLFLAFVMSILSSLFGCNRHEAIPAAPTPAIFDAAAWEREITNSSLAPVEFTQLFASLAAAELKDAKVEVTGLLKISISPMNGTAWDFNLGNVWADATNNPTKRADMCRFYLKSMSGIAKQDAHLTGNSETNSVVPTIKDDQFLSQFPKDAADKGIVVEKMVADLNIVYATDRAGVIAFLMEKDRKRYNLELSDLRKLAVKNLKQVLQPIQLRKYGVIYAVTTGDGYSSSILLLDDFWDRNTNSVEGEIVAVVPARDGILFTGSNSPEGIKQLRQMAEKIYAHGDHIVSKTLLVRRGDHWEPFKN